MEDHGAEGVAQEAQVGADDDGSSEGEDEVVVDPLPANPVSRSRTQRGALSCTLCTGPSNARSTVTEPTTYYEQWKKKTSAEICCRPQQARRGIKDFDKHEIDLEAFE